MYETILPIPDGRGGSMDGTIQTQEIELQAERNLEFRTPLCRGFDRIDEFLRLSRTIDNDYDKCLSIQALCASLAGQLETAAQIAGSGEETVTKYINEHSL